MKYKFKPVPDPYAEGFVREYLEAKSKIIATNQFRLEIDHDLCAPMETWKLIQTYRSDGEYQLDRYYTQQVYHGRELTAEQRDMMVELVMEHEYLDYGEFINSIPTSTTSEN